MKTIRERFRAVVLVGAAVSVLAFAGGAKAQNQNSNDNAWMNEWWSGNSSNDNTWPYAKTGHSPVLAVVGDVACEPDADYETGEAQHETCDTPKAPYTSTASTPPGPPYSLWQSQEATANQIENMKPDAVALLGDLQYQVAEYQDFEKSYDLTFGAFKKITYPAPGNHEFYDEHSETGVAGYGYFSYFNGFQISTSGTPVTTTLADPCPSSMTGCGYPGLSTPTAQPIPRSDGQAGHFEQSGGVGDTVPVGGPVGVGDGWYSYNLGTWHLISLNIECETQPGGCSDAPGTWFARETEWLKQDLAANHSACTLAYWHQPTFSGADSLTEEGITAGTWWQLLYEAGADLVLNGHDHLYARYAPVKPYFAAADTSVTGVSGTWLGTPDARNGIREFIVGTGGETLDAVVSAPSSPTDWDGMFNQQNLQAATGDYWGVMALTLNPDGYAWDYESALAGPAALQAVTSSTYNGPTFPAPNANGSYSDKGSATCHGGPSADIR